MAELLRLPRVARLCEHLDCHARVVPPREVHLKPVPPWFAQHSQHHALVRRRAGTTCSTLSGTGHGSLPTRRTDCPCGCSDHVNVQLDVKTNLNPMLARDKVAKAACLPLICGRLTSPKAPLPSSTFWPRASRWITTSSGRSAGSRGADATAAGLLLVSSTGAFWGW